MVILPGKVSEVRCCQESRKYRLEEEGGLYRFKTHHFTKTREIVADPAMTVELRIAQNNDAEEWDALIAQSPHGTLFHTWNWLKITEKHTHTKLFPVMGIQDTIPIGILPLFFQKKGPLRMAFSPPPESFLPYLGPVLAGFDTLKQEKRENNYIGLHAAVEHFLNQELHANYTSISLPPALQDLRPFTWSGYSTEPQYDYVTDLSIGPDALLQTLDKKLRQNMNRARKRSMTVEIGGKRELETILDLMEVRYAEQEKFLGWSKDYFPALYDAYKDNLKIFVVNVDDEVVTGSIDFEYRDGHYSWIGGPKPKNPISPSPNDFLIGESVRYAAEQGFRYYVTMSAASDQRLHSYYVTKYNPECEIRYTVKKTSFVTGLSEKGYLDVYKPIKGKILHMFKK